MNDEYTPTTDDVRAIYAEYRDSNKFYSPSISQSRRYREAGGGRGEFDRWLERVRAEERERCLKAVERQAPETGRDINISQYREGLNDGVWRAVSAIDRLPAIRAVSEQDTERSAE